MNLNAEYRPKTLDRVVGQESVCDILDKQIKSHTLKQCLLFVGPAGTGKTTVARIIANTINAEIFELDAASNNGIDNIRQLQDEAFKTSMLANGKCFILDECHSLTSQSWQALLKIIEEPPDSVYFILCTTESQKIPETILSRVQRFDFTKISRDGIIFQLNNICANEELSSIDFDALEYIADLANGCMRQAVTYLEKCLSVNKEMITVDIVKTVLGRADENDVLEFLSAILDNDIKTALSIIDRVNTVSTNFKLFFNQCFSKLLAYDVECFKNNKEFDVSYLEWLLDIREHLNYEDLSCEYVQSKLLLLRYD